MALDSGGGGIRLRIGETLGPELWLPKSWTKTIPLDGQGGLGCALSLTLRTGEAALYDYFPFSAWIVCDGEARAILEFTGPDQERSARIRLPNCYREITLQVESELGARPSVRGLSEDQRELALLLCAISAEAAGPDTHGAVLLGSRKDFPALHNCASDASRPVRMERSRLKHVGQVKPAPEPVFVVGAYRSATSALTWAIGQHPRVFAMEETGWLAPIALGAEAALRLSGQATRSALDIYDIDSNEFLGIFGRAVDELCLRISRQRSMSLFHQYSAGEAGWLNSELTLMRSTLSPKDRWVDGTPEYSHYIPLISRLFPAARFLGMVRDPREVARSMTHMNAHIEQGVTIESALATWERLTLRTVEAATRLGHGRMRILPFATLTSQPAATMDAIWDFLDLPAFDAAAGAMAAKVNSSFDGATRPDLDGYRSERHEAIFNGLMNGARITSLPWSEEVSFDNRHVDDQVSRSLSIMQG